MENEISPEEFERFLVEEAKNYDTAQGYWAFGAYSRKSVAALFCKKTGLITDPVVMGSWVGEYGSGQAGIVRLTTPVQQFEEIAYNQCARYDPLERGGSFAYSMPIFPDEALAIWSQIAK